MTKNLFDIAYQCIIATDPSEKLELTQSAVKAWRLGQLSLNDNSSVQTILMPGLPSKLVLVAPSKVPRRKLSTLEGQAALLHAICHIEFNAINLAWDAVYRFRDLPRQFYDDWIKVADEEAYHFRLLNEQLEKLEYSYGDFAAHNGLWEMAVKTEHDVLVRMALVPRVLEARGLDATPPIIAKLKSQGLSHLVEILEIILREEIGHVAIGSYWFKYFCEQRGLNSETTFKKLMSEYFTGSVKLPNVEARLAAGFSEAEIELMFN